MPVTLRVFAEQLQQVVSAPSTVTVASAFSGTPNRKRPLKAPVVALNGSAGSQQVCPLLKVDRPCHRAAVTSQFDPN